MFSGNNTVRDQIINNLKETKELLSEIKDLLKEIKNDVHFLREQTS